MALRVAVPDLVSNSYFPAIAAVELGFFRQEGLDASVELLFPVTRAMAALRDGELDFVGGAAHATLSAFANWKGARLLAALSQHTYWFLVMRKELSIRRGDLQRLRGLRIGAAPGVDLALQQLLREVGLDPDSDVHVGPVPGTSAGPSVSFGVTAAQALEEGLLDGFWANGMGAEMAVTRGVGTVVLDVRRGDGPPRARAYTFPALVATEKRVHQQPEMVDAAVRALVKAQRALAEDPSCATAVGRKWFPPAEAELIAELVRRDAPFYDPHISQAVIDAMNAFARQAGLLSTDDVSYEQVVATRCIPLWDPGPRHEVVSGFR